MIQDYELVSQSEPFSVSNEQEILLPRTSPYLGLLLFLSSSVGQRLINLIAYTPLPQDQWLVGVHIS